MASTSDFLTQLNAVVADGDKGDIVVSSNGSQWNIDSSALIPVRVVNAGVAISGLRAITTNSTGEAIYASNTVASHAHRVIGISVSSATIGQPLPIYNHEIVTDSSWSWVVDLPIFLGANGLLTQTPPAFPDVFALRIGVALAQTVVEVEIQRPIFLAD